MIENTLVVIKDGKIGVVCDFRHPVGGSRHLNASYRNSYAGACFIPLNTANGEEYVAYYPIYPGEVYWNPDTKPSELRYEGNIIGVVIGVSFVRLVIVKSKYSDAGVRELCWGYIDYFVLPPGFLLCLSNNGAWELAGMAMLRKGHDIEEVFRSIGKYECLPTQAVRIHNIKDVMKINQELKDNREQDGVVNIAGYIEYHPA